MKNKDLIRDCYIHIISYGITCVLMYFLVTNKLLINKKYSK